MKKESNKKFTLSLAQSVLLFSVSLALISFITKLFLYDFFIFLNNALELFIIIAGLTFFLISLFFKMKEKEINNSNIKVVFSLLLICATLLYTFSKVYLLKNNLLIDAVSPSSYFNITLALFYSGLIIFFLIYKVDLRIYSHLKSFIFITFFFLLMLLFSFFFDFVLSGPSTIKDFTVTFIFGFFNTILHYGAFSFYLSLRKKDERAKNDSKLGIIPSTLILLVAFYTLFVLIKDFNHIFYVKLLGPFLPSLVLQIEEADLFFFIYATLFITLVIFTIKESLNKTYPTTKKIVNSAVIVWLIKIANNIVQRVNNNLVLKGVLSAEVHTSINSVLTIISLIFNISLLLCGLIIIFKNKFPKLNLWLGLGIVQVLNFIYNFIASLLAKGGDNIFTTEVTRLSVNFALTIAKLVFVFLILIAYQKPLNPLLLPQEELTIKAEQQI